MTWIGLLLIYVGLMLTGAGIEARLDKKYDVPDGYVMVSDKRFKWSVSEMKHPNGEDFLPDGKRMIVIEPTEQEVTVNKEDK